MVVFIAFILNLCFFPVRSSLADIIINVLAVNGAAEKRETPIRFVLPADVQAKDIVDNDGLLIEYDVNEGAYVAQGLVSLDPKASKTFRIKVSDIWKITPQEVEAIKAEITEAYDKLGKVGGDVNSEALKQDLLDRLDFVIAQQSTGADSVEKRIDSFRIYRDRLSDIKREALSVDYWRSDPKEKARAQRLVRMVIEIQNPADMPKRVVEEKQYLPVEVKPEYVLRNENFQVKFDAEKQKPYLYKEEEYEPGQTRRYEIGIKDVWFIEDRQTAYFNQRATYANDFLKESRFEKTAQFLFERCLDKIKVIADSQARNLEIMEHISAFRRNTKIFEEARKDVEDLEKLVAIYREELEKTKVQNVLQKVRALNDVSQVSDAIFKKKPTMNKSWQMFGWVVLFVGIYTVIHFAIWILRSGDRKKK